MLHDFQRRGRAKAQSLFGIGKAMTMRKKYRTSERQDSMELDLGEKMVLKICLPKLSSCLLLPESSA